MGSLADAVKAAIEKRKQAESAGEWKSAVEGLFKSLAVKAQDGQTQINNNNTNTAAPINNIVAASKVNTLNKPTTINSSPDFLRAAFSQIELWACDWDSYGDWWDISDCLPIRRGFSVRKVINRFNAWEDDGGAIRVDTKSVRYKNIRKALMKNYIIPDLHPVGAASSSLTQFGKELDADPDQEAALVGLEFEQYGCLIGEAGTGKTTTLRRLVGKLEASTPRMDMHYAAVEDYTRMPNYRPAILFCSFMGTAVDNMRRALPEEYSDQCLTIHSALGFKPEFYEEEIPDPINKGEFMVKKKMKFVPTFDAFRKLPYKVVVVDEAGTLTIDPLWEQFISALQDDCRIILVGDISQLPPPIGRGILGFAMTKWPTYALTEVHRTAKNSPIIANAHRVLNSTFPESVPGHFDMIQVPEGSTKAFNFVMQAIKQLHQANVFDPMQHEFIMPQNKGPLGIDAFNHQLMTYFNPLKYINGLPINARHMITTGMDTVSYAVGDKVMVTANNKESKLTNGMTGKITEINLNGKYRGSSTDFNFNMDTAQINHGDIFKLVEESRIKGAKAEKDEPEEEKASQRQASHICHVDFGHTVVAFETAGDYNTLALAYARTGHKMLGRESDLVVILIHQIYHHSLLTNEWLYTAITRARKRCVLLYRDKPLVSCLRTHRIKGRTAQEKMKSFIALETSGFNMPTLPDARKVGS